MKYLFPIIAIAGLVLLIVPAVLRFNNAIDEALMKNLMFSGTVIWFAGAIPWLGRKQKSTGEKT